MNVTLNSTATQPEVTPEEKGAYAQAHYEKETYGPYPSGNRHERRKAAKLVRQDRKKIKW